MSSTTYYFHCDHCKPDQGTCSEAHFRPCGINGCRGKSAWKTVSTSADGSKNKTRIHTPPVEKKSSNPFLEDGTDCWSVTCTTACSKDKCWFEARDEGNGLIDLDPTSPTYWNPDGDDDEELIPLGVFTINKYGTLDSSLVDRLDAIDNDPVNHPKHYTSHPSGVECITITEHYNFNLGNCIKYLWRSDLKDSPLQDLEKASWYLQREITTRKGKEYTASLRDTNE